MPLVLVDGVEIPRRATASKVVRSEKFRADSGSLLQEMQEAGFLVSLSLRSNASSLATGSVSVCPGEGDRYGDYKCNHDGTHRVCATLLNDDGTEKKWGSQTFWQLTKQSSWASQISGSPNPGDSWCICKWATASLIDQVSGGCSSVHLNCDATDYEDILDTNPKADGGRDITSAVNCVCEKCKSMMSSTYQAKCP